MGTVLLFMGAFLIARIVEVVTQPKRKVRKRTHEHKYFNYDFRM